MYQMKNRVGSRSKSTQPSPCSLLSFADTLLAFPFPSYHVKKTHHFVVSWLAVSKALISFGCLSKWAIFHGLFLSRVARLEICCTLSMRLFDLRLYDVTLFILYYLIVWSVKSYWKINRFLSLSSAKLWQGNIQNTCQMNVSLKFWQGIVMLSFELHYWFNGDFGIWKINFPSCSLSFCAHVDAELSL